MMNGVFMNKSFDVENLGNSKKQAEDLKEICIKHSVSYEDLNKMLDSEKVKKLHRRNHYINQVISEIIEG